MEIVVRRLVAPEELREAYALRYLIYCELSLEKGGIQSLPQERYPDGLERDPWDEVAIAFGAFADDKLVGQVRVVSDSALGFVMEAPDENGVSFLPPRWLNRKLTVEASRMVVHPAYRRQGLMDVICDETMRWCRIQGYKWWLLVIQKYLLPSRYTRWPAILEFGPPMLYHGEEGVPILVSLGNRGDET